MALDPKAVDQARRAFVAALGMRSNNEYEANLAMEAAILSYLQHAGEGEPVAFTSPANIAVVAEYDGQPVGVAMWSERRNPDDMPLYAHPALTGGAPTRVKPLEWERISDTGMEGPVRFWRALDPFGGKLWINVSTADFEGACSIGDRQFATSAAAMNHMEADYEARILSTLTTDTPVAGDGANYPVPDGWKLVPVEPTHWMEIAALKASRSCTELPDGLKPLPHGYDGWSAAFVYRAMLAAAPPAQAGNDGWQDIDTAPKDGAPVLLFWPTILAGAKSIGSADRRHTGISVGWYETSEHGVGFMCEGDSAVPSNQNDCTHWRPLPAAPHKGGEGRQAESAGDPPPRCFICDEALKPGDLVLGDVSEGIGHRACFGDDREGFVKDIDTGEPLGPDDPLPTGWEWQP